jgi:hypothetical protein
MRPQPESTNEEVLAGLIERVTYHNSENGFCVSGRLEPSIYEESIQSAVDQQHPHWGEQALSTTTRQWSV